MELGTKNYLGDDIPYITPRRNFSIFGQSQTGKSELLTNLALTDIHSGKNVVCMGDDFVEQVLKHIPRDRQKDVVYFNPAIQPLGFNPLYRVPGKKFNAQADVMVDTVHTLLTYDGSTPVMDDYIRITILTLLHISTITNSLLSMYYFLTDEDFRQDQLQGLHDPSLLKYWKRFDNHSNKEKRDEVKSTLTKLSPYVFNPMLRDCLLQRANHLDFQNKIVLVSLSNLEMGRAGASFIGALVIATIQAQPGITTSLYIDDADRFGGQIIGGVLRVPTIKTVLTVRSPSDFKKDYNEIRKSADAISFRVSSEDKRVLDSDFKIPPQLTQLNELPNFEAYVLENTKPVQLKFFKHNYKRPPRNTRRGHKRVEQSIIDRCWKNYTASQDKISELLEELI